MSQQSRAVTVYSHTDTVMLNLMTADKNIIGVYTCAAKLKGLLSMLTGALWAAALPRSSALWQKQDIPTFRELAGKSFHVVTMITIPLILYFCLFVEPWIHIIGGKEYLDAAQTMHFLLPAVIAIGYSNILGGQMLIPMGQEWETALCGTYRCLQQYSSECTADSPLVCFRSRHSHCFIRNTGHHICCLVRQLAGSDQDSAT